MISDYRRLIDLYNSNQKSLNKTLNTKSKSKGFDKAVREAHDQVFEEIDCLNCANCCKTVGPLFTPSDIKRISAKLKLSERMFTDQFLRRDEDGDMVLQSLPCPFLAEDNRCNIYEYRPAACRRFPHTDEKGQKALLTLTKKNAQVCPAVSQIVQKLAESVR